MSFAVVMYSRSPAHWNLPVAGTFLKPLTPSFLDRYIQCMSALGWNPLYMFIVF